MSDPRMSWLRWVQAKNRPDFLTPWHFSTRETFPRLCEDEAMRVPARKPVAGRSNEAVHRKSFKDPRSASDYFHTVFL